MRETKWYRNLIIISCAAGIVMFWSFFFLYHTYGTSDLIETMNETIKYDMIKPTNKGGEKK